MITAKSVFIKSLLFYATIAVMIYLTGCEKKPETPPSASISALEIQEDTTDAIEIPEPVKQEYRQEYDDESLFEVTVLSGDWGEPWAVSVDGYKGTKSEINIPPEIQGLPVYYIGKGTFKNRQLTKVSIPDSVMEIGDSAFESNNLTSLTIPANVWKIGDSAFSNNNITRLTMHYGLREIGSWAFDGNKLTTVVIPDSVKEIGQGAFMRNQIASVTTPEEIEEMNWFGSFNENPIATIIITSGFNLGKTIFPHDFYTFSGYKAKAGIYTWDGSSWSAEYSEYNDPKDFFVSINDDGKSVSITGYKGFSKTINIPPRLRGLPVTSVSNEGFHTERYFMYKGISSVTFPDTVTHIGSFQGNKLTSVIIPESVTHIGSFQGNKLTSVIIPESVTHIGEGAFANNQLTSVIIPDNVTEIGTIAFEKNQLTSVTLGKNVTNIGYGAFSENKLTSITIPDSVKIIESYAFTKNSIKRITIPDNVSFEGRGSPQIFELKFDQLYMRNGKKAGTYISQDNDWILVESDETEINNK